LARITHPLQQKSSGAGHRFSVTPLVQCTNLQPSLSNTPPWVGNLGAVNASSPAAPGRQVSPSNSRAAARPRHAWHRSGCAGAPRVGPPSPGERRGPGEQPPVWGFQVSPVFMQNPGMGEDASRSFGDETSASRRRFPMAGVTQKSSSQTLAAGMELVSSSHAAALF